jgi:hypothetical protein
MNEGKALRDGFLSNFHKMQICEKNLKNAQIKLTNPKCDRDKVIEEREEAQFALNNMRGIVTRQLMTEVWKTPSPLYVTKLRNRRSIENELNLTTGQTFPDRKDEAIYEISFDNLLKTLVNNS